MKITLILFFITACTPALSSVSDHEREELQRRIKLYQLDNTDNLEPVLDKMQREYDPTIKSTLNQKITNNTIPALEEVAGRCDRQSCVRNFGYYQVNLPLKNICLPYTNCGFYKCMEEQYQCEKEGVDYFTGMAQKACKRFESNIQKKWFSQVGYEWIYSVMVCLQDGLIKECEIDQNCTKSTAQKSCQYIKDFNLKFHKQCYLNSGIGVCKLPLRDKINLWKTISPFMRFGERKQIYEVILSCIRRGL